MMTRIRQHFNPSTLKPAYNAVTGKAMVVDLDVAGDPCGCGPTPKYVDVTFDSIANCCYGFGGDSCKATSDLNGTFRLTYTSKAGDYCYWQKDTAFNSAKWDENETCSGAPDHTYEETSRIILRLDTSDSTISICYYCLDWTPMITPEVIFFSASAAVDSGCVEPSGALSNSITECEVLVDCQALDDYLSMAEDGTVEIVQI